MSQLAMRELATPDDFLPSRVGREGFEDWGRGQPLSASDPPYGSILFLIERDFTSLYYGSSVSSHDIILLNHPQMR
jgi:hypothetical protein